METARRLTHFHPKIKHAATSQSIQHVTVAVDVLPPSGCHDSLSLRFAAERSRHQVNLFERHVGRAESLDGRLSVVKTHFLNDLPDVLKVFTIYQLQQLNVALADKMAQMRVYGADGQLPFSRYLSRRQATLVKLSLIHI